MLEHEGDVTEGAEGAEEGRIVEIPQAGADFIQVGGEPRREQDVLRMAAFDVRAELRDELPDDRPVRVIPLGAADQVHRIEVDGEPRAINRLDQLLVALQ